MWDGIQACVDKISGERLNPVYWFSVFRYPALLAMGPLTLALQVDSTFSPVSLTFGQMLAVLLAVALTVVGYVAFAYVGLVRAISSLGRDLDDMLQLLTDDEYERPSLIKPS